MFNCFILNIITLSSFVELILFTLFPDVVILKIDFGAIAQPGELLNGFQEVEHSGSVNK